jgi:hypothetical protein
MKQNTPDILRLRTFIFPGEEQKAYVESKNGCYIPFLVTLASDAERITWSLRAIETMQRATVLLQMQSVLVGIPKIHLSVRSLSSF